MPTKKEPTPKDQIIADKKNTAIAKSPVKVGQNGETQPKRGGGKR